MGENLGGKKEKMLFEVSETHRDIDQSPTHISAAFYRFYRTHKPFFFGGKFEVFDLSTSC